MATIDLCVECKQTTAPGSGLFINRTETGNGWLCRECMYSELCHLCETQPPLDDEIVCAECYEGDDL